MDGGLVNLLIGLACGAAGGNIAGALMKDKSLGTLWNSVVGILGGGIGAWVLGMLGLVEPGGIISPLVGSTVGGGVLLAIVSLFKK
jgi:uncharacterized membrane protein YeaQ/YmgE (transglycosylase-associated protein family)